MYNRLYNIIATALISFYDVIMLACLPMIYYYMYTNS